MLLMLLSLLLLFNTNTVDADSSFSEAMTMNSGPTQRFVAGLGVGVTSVNGLTTLYSLEGFLLTEGVAL